MYHECRMAASRPERVAFSQYFRVAVNLKFEAIQGNVRHAGCLDVGGVSTHLKHATICVEAAESIFIFVYRQAARPATLAQNAPLSATAARGI